ncbi:MAG: DUF1893 domain-containing protein [Oscillospiraceae bacterium]|nr:DUF1893 domain-containing protein [Oscillospiraceae bacterium]
MTDIEIAKVNLDGHSICLCRDGEIITDDGRGISPMMRFLAEGKELKGYAAADVIVGKAAAMLFVKAGISAVYGEVMSESAKTFLKSHSIPCKWKTLTERIINRAGTGICPMEQTVAEMEDSEEAYSALKKKLSEMRTNGA